ncbi:MULTISPECIES: hypothetical protein [Marinomonas]|uniref:Uncharacterized protein n=1 Tax=Marinomonas arctica TaxID=383750 RepID=A0A7H1JA02_9GAMM|nr:MULTISPECIES: hypothetical protein [Marinomonas]MCS7488558.1 hypothetical protein [Marinomonas sp. BSi20414]QNT07318.1 hypothetical protein IBG28_06755 [Marinomonas arctica]GGN27547.1 hypothetical protein GCM10011350_18860 [Marinomonas arctica]
MLWFYFIAIYSIPFVGFFGLWQAINMLYVIFFPSQFVSGYFAYKPDRVEIHILYRRNSIYMLNMLRYFFGIERPPMPWYAKINTVFCALGILLSLWICILITLEHYLHLISLEEWKDVLRANGLY